MNGHGFWHPVFNSYIGYIVDENRLSIFRCIFLRIFLRFDGQELEHNPFLRASCENISDEEMGKLRRGCFGCTARRSPSQMALKWSLNRNLRGLCQLCQPCPFLMSIRHWADIRLVMNRKGLGWCWVPVGIARRSRSFGIIVLNPSNPSSDSPTCPPILGCTVHIVLQLCLFRELAE